MSWELSSSLSSESHIDPLNMAHSMFFFERDLDPDLAGSMLFWGMAGLNAKINLLVKTCLLVRLP